MRNLHQNTLKYRNNYTDSRGVISQLGGTLPPPLRGVNFPLVKL